MAAKVPDRDLTDRVGRLAALAIALSTKCTYSTSEQRYLEFCRQYDRQLLPGSDITLIYYTASLTQGSNQPQLGYTCQQFATCTWRWVSHTPSNHCPSRQSNERHCSLRRYTSDLAANNDTTAARHVHQTRWHAIASSPRQGHDHCCLLIGLPQLPVLWGTDLVDKMARHQNRHGKAMPRGLAAKVQNQSIREGNDYHSGS